jgi:hypothetical protein
MSKYIFNAPINSTNTHIGDNYYNSSSDFYKATPGLKYSDTEKQLVELIFERTNSEDERLQILNSLKSIKEDDGTKPEITNSYFEPIKNFLTAAATTLGAKLLAELTFQYLHKQ